MQNFNLKFINEAIKLSLEGMTNNDGGPFGSVVVREGVVIGRGWNKVTSTNDPTAHAEVEAIRDACKNIGNYNLSGCEIYASCEPCPMCLAAIYWARIDKCYYALSRRDAAEIGFDDELLYKEIALPIKMRSIEMIECEKISAQKVFDIWRDKNDIMKY